MNELTETLINQAKQKNNKVVGNLNLAIENAISCGEDICKIKRNGDIPLKDAYMQIGISERTGSQYQKAYHNRDKYELGMTIKELANRHSGADLRLNHYTGAFEWYTPAKYIHSSRIVMGSIDLDPASSAIANEIVKAKKIYSLNDDGLKQPWNGNVWMNPPFSFPLIERFVDKLITAKIKQFVVITYSSTDTKWWHKMAECADAICFTVGRVDFENGDTKSSPPNGSNFFYKGSNVKGFNKEFSKYGRIVKL